MNDWVDNDRFYLQLYIIKKFELKKKIIKIIKNNKNNKNLFYELSL